MLLPGGTRRDRREGFTLIELMVVVAIVGILIAAAVITIKPNRHASARSFADRIAALIDTTRDRAIASHAYQRIKFYNAGVRVFQAPTTGFSLPAANAWQEVGSLYPENDQITIACTDDVTHLDPATSVPSPCTVDAVTLDIAPDGAAAPFSVFVADARDTSQKARVIVYSVTGSVFAYDTW